MSAVTGFFSFFLDKIVNYLRLMEKDFDVLPQGIIVREKISNRDIEVHILPTEKWIRIMVRLDKVVDIPEDKRSEFIEALLKANSEYPEISFGIDDEGFVVSIEDEYVYAFYFDVFEEEYSAVLASVDIYYKLKEKILGVPKRVRE